MDAKEIHEFLKSRYEMRVKLADQWMSQSNERYNQGLLSKKLDNKKEYMEELLKIKEFEDSNNLLKNLFYADSSGIEVSRDGRNDEELEILIIEKLRDKYMEEK
jgi:hypothetical protein